MSPFSSPAPANPGALLLAGSLVLCVAAPSSAANIASKLASRAHGGFTNAAGTLDSFAPVLTGDGRYVVFVSSAPNLVSNDFNGALDVVVRDRLTGQTKLVSATAGVTSGNAASFSPSVSSNGQFIAFQSQATNLVAGDYNAWEDVFLRDTVAGTTALVSTNRPGTGSGNGMSSNPRITPDGRFVVFESFANDLAQNDTDGAGDVYVRDLMSGQTTRVSVPASGGTSLSGYSTTPSIAPDGRFVVFESPSVGLVTNDSNGASDVFVRDLLSQTNLLVSVAANGTAGNGPSLRASISDDGRYVAFESVAGLANTDLDPSSDIYVRDLQDFTNRLVSIQPAADSSTHPVISRDGRLVAFETSPDLNPAPPQIYVWDAQTETNHLVSVALDGSTLGSGGSHSPIISSDNRYITFLSNSTNLVANATNGQYQVYQRDLVTQMTKLVSVNLNGDGNNLDCHGISASDDGHLVAFASLHGNLVPDDRNGAYDVFVRDLTNNTTELISCADPNLASATPLGISTVLPGAVSGDGRYLAFTSRAGNLVVNDANATYDVFVRDLWNGTNALVSVSSNGVSGNDVSQYPVLSANGRFVAFVSRATDLTANVTNTTRKVYLRDLQQGDTTLVMANTNGVGSAGQSTNLAISGDGRWIVYQSNARDLNAADASSFDDIFAFDRSLGTNLLVSMNVSGTGSGNGASRNPVIAPDGRTVLFLSDAKNLVTNSVTSGRHVFAHDLENQTTSWVSFTPLAGSCSFNPNGQVFSADSRFVTFVRGTNLVVYDFVSGTNVAVHGRAANPALAGSGRFVVFEKPLFLNISITNSAVMAYDIRLGAEMLVSRNHADTSAARGWSRSAVISADGRYVVFQNQTSDLVADADSNNVGDLFVRDLVLGQTLLISLNETATGSGNRLSANPILGADGRTVVFESFASDLAAADFNQTKDLFILRLGLGDSDGDGMDDDWEMTYFSTLARDGYDDSDQDGLSDLAEFKAGTNPINDASILRVLTVTSFGSGAATVYWQAVPGRTYQVQFKNELADSAWVNVPGTVLASSTTASKAQGADGFNGGRFYRVLLVSP